MLTLPFPLRYRLAWVTALCAAVLRTFLRVVFGFYAQQATTALGLPGGRTGSVTFIQSFGSTLDLNVHFHALVLDGVYVGDPDGDAVVFHPIPPPRTSEVQHLVDTIRDRVQRLLVRRGLLQDSDATDDLEEQEGLRLMQQASVAGRVALGPRAGRKARCLRGPPRPGAGLPNRCAQSGWFNLHAGVRIAPCDAEGRERLCRCPGCLTAPGPASICPSAGRPMSAPSLVLRRFTAKVGAFEEARV